MRKPTIQEYRLAAWLKLYREKQQLARDYQEKAVDNDIRGFYSRADADAKRGNECRQQAEGMLAAIYTLGFSYTQAWKAEQHIQEFIFNESRCYHAAP